MTDRPFTFKGYRTKEYLELVYTNMCGPFNGYTWERYGHFITFSDDYK